MDSFLKRKKNTYKLLEKDTLISRYNLGNYLTVLLNKKYITKVKVGKRVIFSMTDNGFNEFNYYVNGVLFI
tara:strand:- start:624 stop:836 length:213 start_codon:yes stop_codon:yes gene_type:complete